MAWGKSLLLTIPLVFSGIFAVASPASAQEFSDTDWKTVSAGGSHACGTDNSGYLYCWGNDDSGQLGNSETLNSKTTPNRVGSSSGWTLVSAGGSHTCGVRSGKLYCWGSDEFGQLGNGSSRDDRATPGNAISGATDWVAVTTGATHTCGIRNISGQGRKLACWGDDSRRQIGNGAGTVSPPVPTSVSTATNWAAITAGAFHTCGIRTIPQGRTLACWGDDDFGQVGNGAGGEPELPTRVSSAFDWRSISAGDTHTCAVRTAGRVACWGSDASGQIGNGGGTPTLGPDIPARAAADLPADWKDVSAGGAHTCAIRGTSNTLYCWGDNTYGQSIASSEDVVFASPQPYPGGWKAQDTGQRHTCAIASAGELTCWGVPEVPPDCPTPPTNVYADDPWHDLGYWKLTTPIDSNNDDKPDEVKQPALKTLDGKDYFDRQGGPSIMFRARVDGVTTSGSSFPRSELREMTQDGQYNRAAWTSNCGTHRMTITQEITAQPNRANPVDPVVAGQIHDGGVDGGHGDVVMIRLEGTRLFVEGDGNDHGTLDSSYTLGERFTVVVTADSNGIDVSYSNSDSSTTATINNIQPQVNNEQWFFKAGCYTQANTSNGTGYGEVVIYNLNVEHS